MNSEILEKFASLVAGVGINAQANDGILLNASYELADMARLVARECWKKGARDVIVRLNDVELYKIKLLYAKDEVFDEYPSFEVDYMEALLKRDYARISLSVPDLKAFEGMDKDRLKRLNAASSKALEVTHKYMDSGRIKWTVINVPSVSWAKVVYPELGEEEGLNKLWQDVISVMRLDSENPVKAWQEHDDLLKIRQNWLNEQGFEYMEYKAPGTDLKVYLADEHVWLGGSSVTPSGIRYMPNMPTEEIFSAPHRLKVYGKLRATLPLCFMGNIIEGMEFEFDEGKVVSFKAEKNGEILESMMNMDEGASRLGEIAIVPNSSPIKQVGRLFMSTLFDENASCHFAVGTSYANTVKGGENMSEEERLEHGANKSMIHIDFMVGSAELNITGVKKDGTRVPVLVNGEFVEL